jgi:hypothetical protein
MQLRRTCHSSHQAVSQQDTEGLLFLFSEPRLRPPYTVFVVTSCARHCMASHPALAREQRSVLA